MSFNINAENNILNWETMRNAGHTIIWKRRKPDSKENGQLTWQNNWGSIIGRLPIMFFSYFHKISSYNIVYSAFWCKNILMKTNIKRGLICAPSVSGMRLYRFRQLRLSFTVNLFDFIVSCCSTKCLNLFSQSLPLKFNHKIYLPSVYVTSDTIRVRYYLHYRYW